MAYSLAGLPSAQAARARALAWLARATPQRHDPLVAAADQWLLDLSTNPSPPALPDLPAPDGPHRRRALYLNALGCAAGAPGADARHLLEHARTALGRERGSGIKPWQRSLLLAFEAIARAALNAPFTVRHLTEDLGRAQSADGSCYGMPLVTGMLHLALRRVAPDHPVTRECLDSLLGDQQPDGTWRFLVSEVWDTGLMVRSFRGHPRFEASALDRALAYLASAQNDDGGWGCTAELRQRHHGQHPPGPGRHPLGRARPRRRLRLRQAAPDAGGTVDHLAVQRRHPGARCRRAHGSRDQRRGTARDLPRPGLQLAGRARHGRPVGIRLVHLALLRRGRDRRRTHRRTPDHAVVTALLGSQRADGGWPRILGDPYSSPTATGLALSALTTGDPAVPQAALERAMGFLTDTQTDDGTWHDRPVMYGPRPFLTVTSTQVHALAARGRRDALTVLTSPREPIGAGR